MIQLDQKQLEIVKNILKQIIPNDPVFALGSRTTTTFKPHSDLDLCVMGKHPLSFSQMAILREAFSESDLPIRVDIIDWSTISSKFRQAIKPQLVKFI